ncbi:alanine racemase [Blastococcus sp. PRF04-17]|uniref:alanine racemase n=1 Tax=Blastococcus sp. PRF04-17 TaxID=2933797 RepID=UPI002112A9F0|nr:alanine racemase [Blastococcus sp. PRF04-17]
MTDAAPRAEVIVDLDAIAANTATLREHVGRPLMAVVKADGYGHGLVPAARAVLAAAPTPSEWPCWTRPSPCAPPA